MEIKGAGTGQKAYTVVYDPNGDELIRVHAAGCPDVAQREVPAFNAGRVSCILEVEAESGWEAVEEQLREDFSGVKGLKHPPRNGYPGGSYGAVGFTGWALPCCKRVAK